MPLLSIPIPERLERGVAAEYVAPDAANYLRRMDLLQAGGIRRGPGVVRADFTTGLASTPVSCGRFQRRDGRSMIVWQTAAGSLDAQVDPEPALLPGDF